eukprot:1071787-Karenia_brevis.AAC.1
MAFEHLAELDFGHGLPPSGVLLSGDLPAVLCFGPDSQFAYPTWDVPTWTGETVGGCDLVDKNTA